MDPAAKAAILRVHVPIALGVLTLMLLRIVWPWGFNRKPYPVAGSPHWQDRAAQAVHILFYVVILGLAASGIGILALSGAAPSTRATARLPPSLRRFQLLKGVELKRFAFVPNRDVRAFSD